ncbi:MAG: hypothetical protein ACR2NW_09925 [Thermodesulfobacteriota bacterium]
MHEEKKFSNLNEAIDYIVSQLSNNEKDLIKNGDPNGLQMGLAGWVNKEFVNNENMNFTELIYEKVKNEDPNYKQNPDKPLYIHPDNIAGFIIEELIEKLKN